ncbi:hypothetical protein DDE18_15615 [Nocardioides gansuensis]|uniref:GmrSD restriction endonucleases N-terminal domain-containing protein n=1 Tax=Nocardioides gansuensis TaxID=2138300 RepID=A0A2T8F8T7_9ACTN|nr:DUF262 domain-containing protein [Nocardioides gansuensis]PVG82105.1 hypothetical protein DDE18_15615 [Nocardioides gansuensis]
MKIRTELLPEISVSRFMRMKNVVDLDPPYQREADVWKPAARSVLIDSIINGLDVPKLYFEAATARRVGPEGLAYQYAVIDGKQRLGAILAFLSGQLALAEDFLYFEDETVKAAGMTLPALEEHYPLLARRFLDYELPIVRVTSDSGDLIEEMFQRLNASTALNAAERRNALTGPTRDAANALAEHQLLVARSPIRSARYKYRELGAKFLAIEHQLATRGKIVDTKADTLYDLFVATRGASPRIAAADMDGYKAHAVQTLDRMVNIFEGDDRLLASIGTVVVYYIAFRNQAFADEVNRGMLAEFEDLRRQAAQMVEDDPAYTRAANARLREYNGLVQSTNDGRAIARRAEVLATYVAGHTPGDPLAGLDGLGDGELPDRDETEES